MIEQDVTRTSVVFTWDKSAVGESDEVVELTAVNPNEEHGHVHNRFLLNDGEGAVWFANDYTGVADLTVTGSKGSDSGQVSVG